MSDDDITASRRTVLKNASVTAALGVVAAGTAAADHCDCYHEYRCNTDYLCEDPSTEYPYLSQSRECCDCDGDGNYDCSAWEATGGCCAG